VKEPLIKFVVASSTLVVAGCAAHWEHASRTRKQAEADESVCRIAARRNVGVSEVAANHAMTSSQVLVLSYSHFGTGAERTRAIQNMVDDCMTRFGYQKK
jgi:hypothetical protein